MEKRIKIGRAIINDYILMIALMFIFIVWGLFLVMNVIGFVPNISNPSRGIITKEDGGSIFFYIAIISSFIFAPIFIIRLNRIRLIIRNGEIVMGRIVSIEFFKDRGRISVEYNYNKEEYKKGVGIMKSKITKEIKSGDEKELIINKYSPAQFLISDLYCE